MAQQLTVDRTSEAYAGVLHFAQTHTGEAQSAAYLSLGHAYLADKRFDEATRSLQMTSQGGDALADYAEYLTAQAYLQGGKAAQAETVLTGFAGRHPDSIFATNAPLLLAQAQLQQSKAQAALATLATLGEERRGKADAQLLRAKALLLTGDSQTAAGVFKHIYTGFPLSAEATQSKQQLGLLASTGITVSVAERHARADALYAGHHYAEASEEFHALANDSAVRDSTLRADLMIDAAACDLKLKKLNGAELERLADTQDDHGAERLYLLMEAARDKDNGERQRALTDELMRRFPSSQWFAEALLSSGNMYLLRRDFPNAIHYYGLMVQYFPKGTYAPYCHWKTAWLNYRLGNWKEASRLFEEQIARYGGGEEVPGALYWRGRLLEDQEHQPAQSKSYYQALTIAFRNYYYAELAKERLAQLTGVAAQPVALVAGFHTRQAPQFTDEYPQDDEHVIKAGLLANAGLNEYIAPEIRAASGSASWAGYAEAMIYNTAGDAFRAMQALKRNTPGYYAVRIEDIPASYWKILFPQPFWNDIESNSKTNGLDPYLVLSLMRQESEFDARVISYANAYGLMQLLPSTGKSMAKAAGLREFSTNDLLNPHINIQLGTLYVKHMMDEFNGQVEYTLAAYNAGDFRVHEWLGSGTYRDMPEFVESIPFTQTREYVEAIVRNTAMYKRLNNNASAADATAPAQ